MHTLTEPFILLGLALLLCAIFLLALSKRQREALFGGLSVDARGRRASTSKTPPRSLTPEKKVPGNVPPPVEYKDIYPPSRREALPNAAQSLPLERKKKLAGRDVDPNELGKSIIPFTADYHDCGPSTFTPTGVSIEEVKALGDFPDYAELSGVPLPEPYKEFNIENARPRLYRPFRWAYHQTMCMIPGYNTAFLRANRSNSAHKARTQLVA